VHGNGGAECGRRPLFPEVGKRRSKMLCGVSRSIVAALVSMILGGDGVVQAVALTGLIWYTLWLAYFRLLRYKSYGASYPLDHIRPEFNFSHFFNPVDTRWCSAFRSADVQQEAYIRLRIPTRMYILGDDQVLSSIHLHGKTLINCELECQRGRRETERGGRQSLFLSKDTMLVFGEDDGYSRRHAVHRLTVTLHSPMRSLTGFLRAEDVEMRTLPHQQERVKLTFARTHFSLHTAFGCYLWDHTLGRLTTEERSPFLVGYIYSAFIHKARAKRE
jgi:hypothetical protein